MGLAPFCKDTFFGQCRLRIWRRRGGVKTGVPLVDATTSTAALEVGRQSSASWLDPSQIHGADGGMPCPALDGTHRCYKCFSRCVSQRGACTSYAHTCTCCSYIILLLLLPPPAVPCL